MTRLEQLRADHGPAVLDFELVNRDYFALSVADRGNQFFDQFTPISSRTLTAATSDQNVASRRVLINAGFVFDGPADPSELGGKRGSRYRRDLAGQ